ncbi:lytic transglycosylase domain-containing protein [Aquiflexum lacus]|uniref:lytic transglycosylase domain-containing protein n=1 Tax=Aquiflexum lacus TaxID=2483805 RepID=UPI001894BDC1|nr:lytic transglycosylase domain-containing protein [Aquiflexum lacus]
MKNHIQNLLPILVLVLFFQNNLHGQELFGINNSPIEEETILPVYQFEYIPDFSYNEVANKIKAMETDMPFELNERIFAFINYFTVRNRDYTKMVLQRQDIFFPLFEQTLADHNMPDDIKFLAIIESGLNPTAKSRVGAMGLWQFMPATGKMYSLNINRDIDDRMDPEMSTEAAAKYLKSLYRMFGNWELALAAYNCGPGNVRKAIRRSGGKKTFWEVYKYLPRETRSYVPQFQAMMYVLRHTEDHNFVLENPTYPIAYEKINFNQELDLEELANITGICIEDLEDLNPSVQNRLIPSTNKHMAVRVPKSKSEYITQNYEQFSEAVKLTTERSIALRSTPVNSTNSPAATIPANQNKIIYVVKSGDVLGSIAQRHGTTVNNIKAWNNISSNTIRIGQKLDIYTKSSSFDKALAQNNNASTTIAENPKTYTVQPGDSLWLISKKHNGISIEQIKKLNNLNTNQIKPGQKLIIG